MKAKMWIVSWLLLVMTALIIAGSWVYKVDPFFHYHKPDLEKYFYRLDNERSQNDGICKHFEYDALVTGTSMTSNFNTSEMDELFGCNSIKVAYVGASYKEISDNIERALDANDELKLIIRCLDMDRFFPKYNDLRTDLGWYPTYLYDSNPFNDLAYLLNRDVLFDRVYRMVSDSHKEGFHPGITDFDEYSRWQSMYSFGINEVCPEGIVMTETEQSHLTDEDKEAIKKNIDLNATDIVERYPNVEFYYFYSPYSIVEWNEWRNEGTLYKMLEAEEYITELLLQHENVHLFSFNSRTDITTDLNHYKDSTHYACWINSLMLKWMHDGQYQLTQDNYRDMLKREYDFYTTYDYESVNGQEDYEDDFSASVLLNKELTWVDPLDILKGDRLNLYLNGVQYLKDDDGRGGVSIYNEEENVVKQTELGGSDLIYRTSNVYMY